MDIVTNYIEASLGRVGYSLWTSLEKKKKEWYIKLVLDGSEDKCLILGPLDNVLQ